MEALQPSKENEIEKNRQFQKAHLKMPDSLNRTARYKSEIELNRSWISVLHTCANELNMECYQLAAGLYRFTETGAKKGYGHELELCLYTMTARHLMGVQSKSESESKEIYEGVVLLDKLRMIIKRDKRVTIGALLPLVTKLKKSVSTLGSVPYIEQGEVDSYVGQILSAKKIAYEGRGFTYGSPESFLIRAVVAGALNGRNVDDLLHVSELNTGDAVFALRHIENEQIEHSACGKVVQIRQKNGKYTAIIKTIYGKLVVVGEDENSVYVKLPVNDEVKAHLFGEGKYRLDVHSVKDEKEIGGDWTSCDTPMSSEFLKSFLEVIRKHSWVCCEEPNIAINYAEITIKVTCNLLNDKSRSVAVFTFMLGNGVAILIGGYEHIGKGDEWRPRLIQCELEKIYSEIKAAFELNDIDLTYSSEVLDHRFEYGINKSEAEIGRLITGLSKSMIDCGYGKLSCASETIIKDLCSGSRLDDHLGLVLIDAANPHNSIIGHVRSRTVLYRGNMMLCEIRDIRTGVVHVMPESCVLWISKKAFLGEKGQRGKK